MMISWLDWKTGVVKQALSAQGIETAFRPIKTSAPQTRRRASISARRTKKGCNRRVSCACLGDDHSDTGLSASGSDPLWAAFAVWPRIWPSSAAGRKGELSVLATVSESGLDLAVTGGKPLDGTLRIELAGMTEKHNLARLAWEDEVVATRQPPIQDFGGVKVVPPAGAFLQATKDGEHSLRDAVTEIIQGSDSVVDLFAGSGTFALPAARHAEVHAVEGLDRYDRGAGPCVAQC